MALSDEQKKLRAEAYGSSEVATIVGKRHPGALMRLYEAKRTGNYDDAESSLPADLGTLLEDPVATKYAELTSTWVAPVAPLRHPTKKLAVASPDRARFVTEESWRAAYESAGRRAKVVDSLGRQVLDAEALADAERLVEVKTHAQRFRRDYGPAGTGQVPNNEAIQVTWQLGCAGLKVADLPVLFRGDFGVRIEVFTVAWNSDLFDRIYEAVERFHVEHVLAGVPPPPDGSDAYDDALERTYPRTGKDCMVASAEEEELMLRFGKLKAVEKRAEKYAKLLGQDLKLRIGQSGGLSSARLGTLRWSFVNGKPEVDWQKAATDALALAGQCINAFGALRAANEHLRPDLEQQLQERLRAIVPSATSDKAGYDKLQLYPKKGSEADLQLARLNLVLDALDPGASE